MKYVKEEIQNHLISGKTLKQLGATYGVSKQRIYQVLQALDIPTPEQNRKKDFKTTNAKTKWAWKIIGHRLPGSPKTEKLALLESLDLPDVCPILGLELDYTFGKGTRNECSPSIDRIDSNKGYEIGNCIVVSWRANRIKNDGTPEEHRKIAEFYGA